MSVSTPQSHYPIMRQKHVSGLDDIIGLLADPERDWQDDAVCSQTDPESFFPEKGGSTKEAKKICLTCPVRNDCLQYALDHDERFGIWGGYSERERRRLKRGELIEPTLNRGGYQPPAQHEPSYACYQRGCRTPECCEAKAAYEREFRLRKKLREQGGDAA